MVGVDLPSVRWSELRWGTLGEWAAALGAIALIAVTIFLWAADRRRQDDRAVLERAAGVNAWFEAPRAGAHTWRLVVTNSSAWTIYEWVAAVWFFRGGPPGGGPHREVSTLDSANYGPLEPGARLEQELPWATVEGKDGVVPFKPGIDVILAVMPPHPAQNLRVAITWRDATGDRWWLRYRSGLYQQRERYPYPWAVSPTSPSDDPDELAATVIPQLKRL